MQRYTVYLYLETALHVSDGTTTHHQERKKLYLQHLVFVTPLLLSAAIVEYNIYPTRCNVTQFIYIWKLLYMFRMVQPPIINSANNCIYSIWYLSHRYCYLPLSWNIIYIRQDATLHSLFYLETALYVSDGTTTHHQQRKQLYLQHLVFVTPLLLYAAIVEELEPV